MEHLTPTIRKICAGQERKKNKNNKKACLHMGICFHHCLLALTVSLQFIILYN
jgi:hypothetical protein